MTLKAATDEGDDGWNAPPIYVPHTSYRLRVTGPAAGEANAVLNALCRLAYKDGGRLRRSLAYHLMAFAARTDFGPFVDGNMTRLLTMKLPDSARSHSFCYTLFCR